MTNLVEKITYNYEDFIDDIIIIDPDMVHRGPTIGKKKIPSIKYTLQILHQLHLTIGDVGKDSTKKLSNNATHLGSFGILELPNKIHWKTIKDQIISSHYNLHFGHCIQLGAQSYTF